MLMCHSQMPPPQRVIPIAGQKNKLLLHMGHQNKGKHKDLLCNHLTSARLTTRTKVPTYILKSTVEPRYFEVPREMEKSSK